jgi:poly(hydroxyalkanoate) depolymerase family esterase
MRRQAHLLPLSLLVLVTCASACASYSSEADESEADESIATASSAASTTITEVTGFGSNPGALTMFEHVPPALPAGAPMVVVLHGCTETAASAAATGWNDVADEASFLVVYAQQETANNPLRCFNWAGEYGNADNLTRGKGENLSIKQMVDKAVADHGSDPKRVFVAGFSAGGGTAAIMTATYPDVFAGGAILAGIPFNCTTTYAEVSGCQKPGKTKTAAAWAALVKAADPGFAGPWPRMSIWQGSVDTTVGTANRNELVKQWTGVHGVDGSAPVTDTVDGHSHAVYTNSAGVAVVETYEIAGMAHAVPVVPAAACGAASTYAVDKGICAARRAAAFFGLTAGSADGGADGAKPGAGDSGAVSSSSSTGEGAGDGGVSSGGGGPSGAADPGGSDRHGSTCAVPGPVGGARSSSLVALLGALAVFTVARARSRSRSRRAGRSGR